MSVSDMTQTMVEEMRKDPRIVVVYHDGDSVFFSTKDGEDRDKIMDEYVQKRRLSTMKEHNKEITFQKKKYELSGFNQEDNVEVNRESVIRGIFPVGKQNK